jgi:hypothetical protein
MLNASPNLALALATVLSLGCAGSHMVVPPPAAAPPPDSCPYRYVFVDPENISTTFLLPRKAESLRQFTVVAVIDVFSELGLWMVTDPGDAYWTLESSAMRGPPGFSAVSVGLDNHVQLARHIQLFLIDDAEFPYRGSLGFGAHFTIPGRVQLPVFRQQVQEMIAALWKRESVQVDAACSARARTLQEGWASIEQLRQRMVEEMSRVRRRRATDPQGRQLELDATGADPGQNKRLELEVEDLE